MTDPIVFPDTTALVVAWLDGNLAVPTGTRIPNPRPESFVTVRRTGGPQRNLVTDNAQITVESWAATDEVAHDLAQEARGLINALPGEVIAEIPIYRVGELSGPADLPDPLSDQSRYTQSFSVAARAYQAAGS